MEQDPELIILRDLEDAELIDSVGFCQINQIHAYDGELNTMTFNCVKNSKAFQQKIQVTDENDLSWLGASGSNSTHDSSSIIQITDTESLIKSEDGW